MNDLEKYINEKFGGNKTKFSQSAGLKNPQSVQQYLTAKKPYYVDEINGEIWLFQAIRKINGNI